MKSLVIIGAGGFGREVLAWARQSQEPIPIKGFIDDRSDALTHFSKDAPILGTIDDYQIDPHDVFICAMGQIETKLSCIERIRARGGIFTQVIHRTAVIGENVELGEGIILCPYSIVTCDVWLGDFVSVNLHSTVAHDVRIGFGSQLHCHVDITGGVVIEDGVLVGSHASILSGIRIGRGATVGAGSVVLRDVEPGTTVFGCPARPYHKVS